MRYTLATLSSTMFAASPAVPFVFLPLSLSDDKIKFVNRGRNAALRSSAIVFYSSIRRDDFFFSQIVPLYHCRRLFSLSLSLFHYFLLTPLSLFLSPSLAYHSTSSLAQYPAARCNRFENPTTHALRVAACCTSSSSSCLPSLLPVSAIAAAEPAAVHGDMVQELAARTAKW